MIIRLSDNKDFIELHYDGFDEPVRLTISEAEEVAEFVNKIYYRQDVIAYFEDRPDVYKNILSRSNVDLIDNITEKYAEYRKNANGGDIEDNLHWTECLEKAVAEFKNVLSAYKINK